MCVWLDSHQTLMGGTVQSRDGVSRLNCYSLEYFYLLSRVGSLLSHPLPVLSLCPHHPRREIDPFPTMPMLLSI